MKFGVSKLALLSLSNISKSYGINKVFENVSFTIEEKHRIGFVGINGSGKTTLFKIICDQLSYDEGEIFKSKSLKIGYVEQFVCKDNNIKCFYLNTDNLDEDELDSLKEKITFEDSNIIVFIKEGKENTVLARIDDVYISAKDLKEELKNQEYLK